MQEASLVSLNPSSTQNSASIEEFFAAYLKFLRAAGHHVLFGFPDFTDKKVLASLPVDYAIFRRAERFPLDEYCKDVAYFGINREKISTYVKETQYERAELRALEKVDPQAASIANIHWSKDASTTFDIKFDVPTVIPLCPHEVLFTFTVKEVSQNGRCGSTSSNHVLWSDYIPSRVHRTQAMTSNWAIAFVVNLSDFDGKTLKVDFRSTSATQTC